MHSRRTITALATSALLAGMLAACGGGSSDGALATDGGWAGTTASQRDLTSVIVPDGRVYLMYSAVGDPHTVGGAVQGTFARDGRALASSDALDFSAEGAGIKPAALAALVQGGHFDGSITPAGAAATAFTSRYDSTVGFRAPEASLQRLAGAYTGTAGFALGVRPATFTVTADGAVTSSINGCAITGTATPRSDIGAYDLTITFGPAPCAIPNLGFSGIAYLRADNGRLYATARNAATKQSVLFNGGRT